MKRFNRNIRALDAALQKTPEILKAVRMNLTIDILFGVVNNLMNVFIHPLIGTQRVGEQKGTLLHVLSDRFLNRFFAAAWNHLASHIAAVPLKQSHDRDLANKSRLGSDLLGSFVLVHESGRAADECLVGFNLRAVPAQLFKGARLHRESDSVHKEPSGLLSYAKAAMDFIRANPVLRPADHPDGREPLIKADGRVFHQGSKLDREHLLAGFALPRPARRNERVGVTRATRAGDAVRPAKRDHEGKRVVWIGKVNDCLLKRFRESVRLLFHSEHIVSRMAYCVKYIITLTR